MKLTSLILLVLSFLASSSMQFKLFDLELIRQSSNSGFVDFFLIILTSIGLFFSLPLYLYVRLFMKNENLGLILSVGYLIFYLFIIIYFNPSFGFYYVLIPPIVILVYIKIYVNSESNLLNMYIFNSVILVFFATIVWLAKL